MVLTLDAQFVNGLGHQAVDDAVGAAGAVVQRRIGQGLRFFKYNAHAFAPPIFAISQIFASTCSGAGIMPPTRLHR